MQGTTPAQPIEVESYVVQHSFLFGKRLQDDAPSRRLRPRRGDSPPILVDSSSSSSSPKTKWDLDDLSSTMPHDVCYHCKKVHETMTRHVNQMTYMKQPMITVGFTKKDSRYTLGESEQREHMKTPLEKEMRLDYNRGNAFRELGFRAHLTFRYCREEGACVARKEAGSKAMLLLCALNDIIIK